MFYAVLRKRLSVDNESKMMLEQMRIFVAKGRVGQEKGNKNKDCQYDATRFLTMQELHGGDEQAVLNVFDNVLLYSAYLII